MSLTVTRPGRRPPYSGSDFPAVPAIEDAPAVGGDCTMGDDCALGDDCAIDDDIVGTSKSRGAPLAYPDTSIMARDTRGRIIECLVISLPAQRRPTRRPPSTSPPPTRSSGAS